MLNIDGVVVGNTRTAINGLDFNRCWGSSVTFKEAPEIVAFKEQMTTTQQERDVLMFCDFHGHSRAKNVFMFGCNNNYDEDNIMKERIFPLIFHKFTDFFNYDDCKFDISNDKDGCGRIAVRK